MFARERGLHRAVAKGARKPGTKLTGKSEPLNINRMLLAKGRSLDIITQCESIETFGSLRKDLERLSYALYYAELTQVFGQGLSEEAAKYFDRLSLSIGLMAESPREPALLCLEFEFALLDLLGIKPELDVCVACRHPLNEQNLSSFNHELGGLLCQPCYQQMRRRAGGGGDGQGERFKGLAVKEGVEPTYSAQESTQVPRHDSRYDSAHGSRHGSTNGSADGLWQDWDRDSQLAVGNMARRREAIDGQRANVFVTPMVWKRLILARTSSVLLNDGLHADALVEGEKNSQMKATQAARRVMQGYIEYKAARRMRSLDLLANLPS